MNKNVMAAIAAAVMTLCIGLAIVAIGGMALFNPNGTAAANSPVQATQNSGAATGAGDGVQAQQLQSLVTQYQRREVQYQQREAKYQQQLSADNTQLQLLQQQNQQYQALVTTLQQRGIISISSSGQVFILK